MGIDVRYELDDSDREELEEYERKKAQKEQPQNENQHEEEKQERPVKNQPFADKDKKSECDFSVSDDGATAEYKPQSSKPL